MAGNLNLPTLAVDFIRAQEVSWDVVGAGIDGGRNGLGDAPAIEFSGGGRLVATYENMWIQEPERHEYITWLAARCNGSFRNINAVLLTDWVGPFPFLGRTTPQPIVSGIPHSDGALFSDGAGYGQATVFGTMEGDAALGAGQIVINIFGNTRNLRWSDWFSIYHPTKGWRAYRYWECNDPVDVTRTVEGVEVTGQQYTLGIGPPLREAVADGTRLEFARPRFVARFQQGFTLETRIKGFWQSRPTLRLVEAY